MAAHIKGRRTHSVSRGDDGNRTYTVVWLIVTDSPLDGPTVVLSCPALPLPGSVWNFDNDYDPWAYCLPTAKITIHDEKEGDPNVWWKVEQTFSTKPVSPQSQRCNDTTIQDPLMEPQKVSGGFKASKREATEDRFNEAVTTSSREQIRGPHNEWDVNAPNLKIEQNVADLQLSLLVALIDTVNTYPIWGCAPRTVKLSNISWEKKYYGQCFFYYTRTFEFEINPDTWDRDILDEGSKALRGHWDKDTGHWVLDPVWIDPGTLMPVYPDALNPNHFDRYKDRNGENCRVILDGAGSPFDPTLDRTLDCPTSPDGAPVSWNVSGFTGVSDLPVYQITHTTVCHWESVTGGVSVVLDYSAPNWVLSHSSYGGTGWTMDNDHWHDMGPNVMVKSDPNALGPAEIVIERVETQPGKIHVEFYNGSDFTLLNVPLTF